MSGRSNVSGRATAVPVGKMKESGRGSGRLTVVRD